MLRKIAICANALDSMGLHREATAMTNVLVWLANGDYEGGLQKLNIKTASKNSFKGLPDALASTANELDQKGLHRAANVVTKVLIRLSQRHPDDLHIQDFESDRPKKRPFGAVVDPAADAQSYENWGFNNLDNKVNSPDYRSILPGEGDSDYDEIGQYHDVEQMERDRAQREMEQRRTNKLEGRDRAREIAEDRDWNKLEGPEYPYLEDGESLNLGREGIPNGNVSPGDWNYRGEDPDINGDWLQGGQDGTSAPDYIEEDPFFKNRVRAPYSDDMDGSRLASKQKSNNPVRRTK